MPQSGNAWVERGATRKPLFGAERQIGRLERAVIKQRRTKKYAVIIGVIKRLGKQFIYELGACVVYKTLHGYARFLLWFFVVISPKFSAFIRIFGLYFYNGGEV